MKSLKCLTVALATCSMGLVHPLMAQQYLSTDPAPVPELMQEETPGDDGLPPGLSSSPSAEVTEGLLVFPNPNNGRFTVQTAEGAPQLITITNILGHVIHRQVYVPAEDRMEIDLSGIPCGIYVLTRGEASVKFQVS